ncbi:uncharacterized protein LOC131628305 [Vicia villosa]|uniref:uncharacterized protein LOC131628305 n=1 Tax=Vicia villosa TaxID=3911 RepID=UPI00273A9DE0|nr:uncharacterized protein LOC131628305 [Vicia villosa]
MSEGMKDLQNKREQLKQAETLLATNLTNTHYVAEVKRCKEEILKTMEAEEQILSQRAKVSWLKLGDGNNSYFHAIIKGKNKATGITALEDHAGKTLTEPKDIEAEVLRFYTELVGTNSNSLLHIDIDAMRKGPQLQYHHAEALTAPVTDLEILQALKSNGENKAPGIDGHINCALLTLIPKFPAAKHVKDLRPIACCTTLYKVISKILTNRLSKVIDTVVDYSQPAFIPGKKAYDTLEWQALEDIMREMSFPPKFIRWIMLRVMTVSYRYNINGHYSDYLPAKRGLRQGDPISPLLFVIAMEYLHRCLRKMQKNPAFKFHPKCGKLGIVNICFADDLMLFTRGDKISVTLLMATFKDFSAATGLRASPTKCKVYFGGVSEDVQQQILDTTGFAVFPMPKCVIKHIEAVCRSFKWSGGAEITRKAPVAWDKMCEPKNSRGLNITALKEWNVATMGKLTWNIQAKADKLWHKKLLTICTLAATGLVWFGWVFYNG